MKKIFLFLLSILVMWINSYSQDEIKSVYKERKPGFYQEQILADQKTEPGNAHVYLSIESGDVEFPTDPDLYEVQWHTPPVSQGKTGTCWCFATTSFLESEVYRMSSKEVKISEMFFVYHEYLERAMAFVRERGNVYFAEGSEAIGVLRMMKKYGAVPLFAYPGKADIKKYHNHAKMFSEMKTYLLSVKESNAWNEEQVAETIKCILNYHLGTPPEVVVVEGTEYTPLGYASEYLGLDPDDYYSFMSTTSIRYGERGELVEPDNWWHEDSYFNIGMEEFLQSVTDATENGYTVCICGDVSEPGYDKYKEVGIIPSFDIPSEYIDEDARELRLYNNSTTDDHCIHIVGHYKENDESWFMIKDSGSGGFDGPNKGYRFIHEDYIKLKMMNIMIHKEGAPILDRLIK